MNIEIVLTPTTGPIDEPLNGFVCGLPPGECVTVRAQLRDSRDLLSRSNVTLSAGRASLEPKPAVIVLSGSSGALAWSSQIAALLARNEESLPCR